MRSALIKTILFFTVCTALYGQDILLGESSPQVLSEGIELFNEKIKLISASKKIFILSNDNNLLQKGDFITIILTSDDGVAARAVVAKNKDSLVGIKILKIYSLTNWKQLKKDLEVKILRGDDSLLFAPKEEDKPPTPEDAETIEGEEDLYAQELALNDGFKEISDENRLIKPDNIVSLAIGYFSFSDDSSSGDQVGAFDFTLGWAYQFQDNLWIEGTGTNLLLNDYPDANQQAQIFRIGARLKYTFAAPLYSYIMPYIGYQLNIVNSPQSTSNQEVEDAKTLGLGKVSFGVTLLKRMVPGWFIKADLGVDLINIGAAVEF